MRKPAESERYEDIYSVASVGTAKAARRRRQAVIFRKIDFFMFPTSYSSVIKAKTAAMTATPIPKAFRKYRFLFFFEIGNDPTTFPVCPLMA